MNQAMQQTRLFRICLLGIFGLLFAFVGLLQQVQAQGSTSASPTTSLPRISVSGL